MDCVAGLYVESGTGKAVATVVKGLVVVQDDFSRVALLRVMSRALRRRR